MPPEGAFFVEKITGTIPACAQGRKLPSQTPNTRPRDGSRFAAKPIDAVYYVIINSINGADRSSKEAKMFKVIRERGRMGLLLCAILAVMLILFAGCEQTAGPQTDADQAQAAVEDRRGL